MDLNHRPRPYQGSVVRSYKNLQVPRGLPKTAQGRTRPLKLWVQLWVENSGFAGQPRLRPGEDDASGKGIEGIAHTGTGAKTRIGITRHARLPYSRVVRDGQVPLPVTDKSRPTPLIVVWVTLENGGRMWFVQFSLKLYQLCTNRLLHQSALKGGVGSFGMFLSKMGIVCILRLKDRKE